MPLFYWSKMICLLRLARINECSVFKQFHCYMSCELKEAKESAPCTC